MASHAHTYNTISSRIISIDWDLYEIDKDLIDITNPINYIDVEFEEGTKLIVSKLRESWTDAQIKRVYRYVLELLQPDYLSDRSQELKLDNSLTKIKIASQKESSFKVMCNRIANNQAIPIINEDELIFNKAVAVIEGYIDEVSDGYISVKSERFNIDEWAIPVLPDKKIRETGKENPNYPKWKIRGVNFKAYYFIFNRTQYYSSISKMELKNVERLSKQIGSIRLYRNGFRVLPYGEPSNDWLKLDSKSRGRSGVNAPFGNINFFGFVEIIDTEGKIFEETASREGLLENDELTELTDFVYKSLGKCRSFVGESLKLIKEKEKKNKVDKREEKWGNKSTNELLDELLNLKTVGKEKEGDEKNTNYNKEDEDKIKAIVKQVKEDVVLLLNEVETLRIWAALGLSIGEFTHDVVQFTAAMAGCIMTLDQQSLDGEGVDALDSIEKILKALNSYIAFFDVGTSKMKHRDVAPIDIKKVVLDFIKITKDTDKSNYFDESEFYDLGEELLTTPMHPSEWYSILFNLYSNSRKAIKRSGNYGKTKIISGIENNYIYLEFYDNGDGIPIDKRERVFNAFYSTSNYSGADSSDEEELTGKGLGLKIVKDIIVAYKGKIEVIDSPLKEYTTCFRIDIPRISEDDIKKYEL